MNFKKHISLFLAVLLLVSNVGLAFNVHYCGDKLASVSLISVKAQKGCCEKVTSKKNSCCKEKKIVFKQKVENRIVKSFSFQFDYAFGVPQPTIDGFVTADTLTANSNLSYYCDANAPPFYKLYSQFLLYDRV